MVVALTESSFRTGQYLNVHHPTHKWISIQTESHIQRLETKKGSAKRLTTVN